MEAQAWHPRDSRRDGYERLHDWHHARKKNRNRAVFQKKPAHAIQIVIAHQDPFAIAFNKWAAAFGADPVADGRADVAADHSDDRDHEEIEAAEINEVAGERHDEFRGKRNSR